jgi:hypothetical protein
LFVGVDCPVLEVNAFRVVQSLSEVQKFFLRSFHAIVWWWSEEETETCGDFVSKQLCWTDILAELFCLQLLKRNV